jgi:hypothetical protein
MSTSVKQKKECSRLNHCHKIKMILDKDLAGDWQYAQAIRDVCAKCKERS